MLNPKKTTVACALFVLLASRLATGDAAAQEASIAAGFRSSAEPGEQEKWQRLASGVRIYLNAPLPQADAQRLLVIYATPNGNTIEQTWGCAPQDNRDWHFDIQHVGAQIRGLREVSPGTDVIVAVVQAPQLSWPAFRQSEAAANQIIRGLVESLARETAATRVALSGHSGGGSFLFGYLEAVETIPPVVERIVLLDANYAYSDERQHGDKLLDWLRGDRARRLIVVAYDDREITLNGKRVVSSTGGTWRASQRMIERFATDSTLAESKFGPFVQRTGRDGQIEFFLHPNPDNKILHTALVGEMNGLIAALTRGTDRQAQWGEFGGPRAYRKWIQAAPLIDGSLAVLKNTAHTLVLPPRAADSPTGSQFSRQIEALPREQREAAVLTQIVAGNVPEFLRSLHPLTVRASDSTGKERTATCFVTPDYLAVGTNDDFFRVPMTPQTAQAIADKCQASLITAKLSDEIWRQAEVQLPPRPLTMDRDQAATFYHHQQLIEAQRQGKPLGVLVAGIKKDVVLTNRLRERQNRVAIYGWHKADGQPIQPLYVGHVDWYVDYSHGIRLLSRQVLVDGQEKDVEEVLKDRELCGLLSNEGPIEKGYK
jgi:hypothetical protein